MRQFVLTYDPTSSKKIVLCDKDYRYIRQILRLNVGDMIKVCYKEQSFDSTICKIDEEKNKLSYNCAIQ